MFVNESYAAAITVRTGGKAMDIRRLEGTERYEAGRISAICFHSREERSEALKEKCISSKDEDWGSFDDDGHIMGRIINNHFTAGLRGHDVCCAASAQSARCLNTGRAA